MGKISVMWDIRNCPLPQEVAEDPHSIAQNIRSALISSSDSVDSLQPSSVSIDVYGDDEVLPHPLSQTLSTAAVRVNRIPCGKDANVKAILVAMVSWVLDNPPPAHILLISGDAGFASVLHQLRLKQYNVLLACPRGYINAGLLSAAAAVFDWSSVSTGIASSHVTRPKENLKLEPPHADKAVHGAAFTGWKEIKNAFSSLKGDLLMPTLRNLEEWSRYRGGPKDIGRLLSQALEMRHIAEVNVPPGNTMVYRPSNTELWHCVDLNNMHHNYSDKRWKGLRQYLLSKKEWKLFSKSQTRYEAAQILKKSGVAMVSSFSVGEILHFLHLLKNRSWISFHKNDWLPLTRNVERISEFRIGK